MHPDPDTSQEPDFNRIACLYRWAEYLTLGPLLQQTRTSLLDHLGGTQHALLFGDGDGRFLAQLLSRYPHLHATAVDTSSSMLRLLQARCSRVLADTAARLHTVQGSALKTPIPPSTDLVVSHFFLDCLTQQELADLTHTVAASVQPGTLWLVSDFEVPDTPGIRGIARLYIRFLYLAFGLLTGLRVRELPDPQAALTGSGFRRLARESRLFGVLYSELWILNRPPSPSSTMAARHNPTTPPFIHRPMDSSSPSSALSDEYTPTAADGTDVPDPYPGAQPHPEPPVPSLDQADPGVFHHEVSGGPIESTSRASLVDEARLPRKGF